MKIFCKEYNEVLRRDRFHFSEETVRILIGVMEKFGEAVYPSPSGEILPDMKDLPFYEVVLEKRNDAAISSREIPGISRKNRSLSRQENSWTFWIS